MSFNGQCWDFVRDYPQVLKTEHRGFYAISIFDPYIEKIIMGRIPQSYWGEEGRKVLSGEDITIDWIRDNIETIDFFNSQHSYVVLRSEQISAKAYQYILDNDLEYRNFFVLLFHGKSPFYEKLKKAKDVVTYTIAAPNFWEMGKLFQFLCQQMKMTVPYDVQNYILDTTPPQVSDYIQALKTIARVSKEHNGLNLDIIKKNLSSHKYDQFQCAKLFGEKKFKDFYEQANLVNDFESYIGLFRFLQGHLLKVADPSYIRKKARASKYDKEIEAQSTLWSADEIKKELIVLADLEILAKTKSGSLNTQLRLNLIRSYK